MGERYEKSAGDVNKVLYIPYLYCYSIFMKPMEGFSMCSGGFWQVWYVLVGSFVLHSRSHRQTGLMLDHQPSFVFSSGQNFFRRTARSRLTIR